MHPILFKFPFAEIRSYYVLWASALFIFVWLTRARAVKRYGIPGEKARSVLSWIYCAGIGGSFAGSVIERMPLYLAGEISAGMLFRGLSSWGGMISGGFIGMWRLRRNGMSIEKFSEAASVPAAAMMAVGRIGCLMEGCCQGIGRYYGNNAPAFALHMHYDRAGFFRFPSQLAESAASLAIMLLLLLIERSVKKHKITLRGAVGFPVFMILYPSYRLVSDRLREVPQSVSMLPKTVVWAVAAAAGVIWLAYSAVRTCRMSCAKTQAKT